MASTTATEMTASEAREAAAQCREDAERMDGYVTEGPWKERAARMRLCALALDAFAARADCALPDCPHDGTGCVRCLRAENEALLSSLNEARARVTEAQDAFNLCDGERLFLRECVTDLEARAIPAHWIGTTLEIRSFTGKAITDVVYVHPGRTDVKRIGPEGTTAKQFATLSDALRAAALESSDA